VPMTGINPDFTYLKVEPKTLRSTKQLRHEDLCLISQDVQIRDRTCDRERTYSQGASIGCKCNEIICFLSKRGGIRLLHLR